MIDESTDIDIEIARNTSIKMCSICLCDVETDKYETPCGHIFHKSCIEGSYIRFHFCPYCRAEIILPVSATVEEQPPPRLPRNIYQIYNGIITGFFFIFVFLIASSAFLLFLLYVIV